MMRVCCFVRWALLYTLLFSFEVWLVCVWVWPDSLGCWLFGVLIRWLGGDWFVSLCICWFGPLGLLLA